MVLQPVPIDSASLSPAESLPTVCTCFVVSLAPQLAHFCRCMFWMCCSPGFFPTQSSAYHLYTLHQRQAHWLVATQRDHAGWRVGCGLQKGKHSLHTHTTGLCEQTHIDKTGSSSPSTPLSWTPIIFSLLTHQWHKSESTFNIFLPALVFNWHVVNVTGSVAQSLMHCSSCWAINLLMCLT